MDSVRKLQRPNPLANANYVSQILFWWLNSLFSVGYKRQLEEDDMFTVLPQDSSEGLGERLMRCWKAELERASKKREKPSLSRAIVHCFWKMYIILGFFAFTEETLRIIQPLLLGGLINFFQGAYTSEATAYLYAAGVSGCAFAFAIIHHIYFFQSQRVGMRIRVALCHLIYSKALRLSSTAMKYTTTGQVVNLLSNDVNRFDQVTIFMHYLWIGPLQAAAVVGLLWQEVGIACLAGISVLVILMPMQTLIGSVFSRYRRKTAIFTDNRIRTMSEVISGMRIIKMYTWEKSFSLLVAYMRKLEVAKIMKTSNLRGMNMAWFFVASKLILYFTFVTYALEGKHITARRVFVAVSFYNSVRLTVTLFFPNAIQTTFEAIISIKRIKAFLILDEVHVDVESQFSHSEKKNASSIVATKITCFWDKSVPLPTLDDVSLSAFPGELVAVIGPVGSGKSSLLAALLGELPFQKGSLKHVGQLAYATQQSCVFPGTVRSNILFGSSYDKLHYNRVVKACALTKDLQLLAEGDMTVIGDRGITLSGGQKARINLARAVYQDADIYLLDDPLSAVDSEVGRFLFDNCICGILKKKPVILVTHQLQYLNAAKKIIILKQGKIESSGTFEELQRTGVDFAALLKASKENEEEGETEQEVKTDLNTKPAMNRQRSISVRTQRSHSSSIISAAESTTEDIMEPSDPQSTEEDRGEGSVGMAIYLRYLRAGAGWFVLFIVLLMNIAAQVLYALQDWWLSFWADTLNQEPPNATSTTTSQQPISPSSTFPSTPPSSQPLYSTNFYIAVYTGLTGGVVICGMLRCFISFFVMVSSSKELHRRMFDAVLHAPITFFDTNPIGRVLNRFSKDIGQMDDLLPFTMVDFMQLFLMILGAIIVAVSVIPWLLILVLPLCGIFIFLRRYYLATSRDIKRLESTTRSPVFSHLSSSLIGLETIRVYKGQQRFQSAFDCMQDLHTASWFLFLTTSRWLAVRLDVLCAIFVTAVSFCSIFLANILDAGSVGLAVSYATSLTGMFQWGVRQSAEVENLMTSVERVMEYSDLKPEAAWESKAPPKNWPAHGTVMLDRVNFRYTPDGPLVLRNLSVAFQAKEKVGIVGRTGAGKSSLLTALFRLTELESGSVIIDDVVIADLGLHDLRRAISIIPQDPVLFTGSMRKNLDPFDEHSDTDLWGVLEEVQLRQAVEDLPGRLDSELAESGSNFSVGQRQLVCLARALLRHNRILVIDEATANVDPRTDALIQQTIRNKFVNCTVLTIAHRLNTIVDCDRILVMAEGQAREFASPHVLLERPDSLFSRLVEQAGHGEAQALRKTAYLEFLKRNSSDSVPTTTDFDIDYPRSSVIMETAF